MKALVLYHANCADGFTAAWVAWRALKDNAEYVAVNYGQPAPDVTGREVYVLDFSFKRPVMLQMLASAKQLVVLDHHKTAQAELAGLQMEADAGQCPSKIVFDMTKCGARLTWEHFFSEPVPRLVRLVEDRDLWLWKLYGSKEISAAIASYPKTFDVWEQIHSMLEGCSMGDLIQEG